MTAEEMPLARLRLDDIIEHVQLLSADADTQDAWLHPCGWTRSEPYRHREPAQPCMPVAELVDGFFDMWPSWREFVQPALTAEGADALDGLSAKLAELDAGAYIDELETLDIEQWADVRTVALATLGFLGRAGQHE